MQRKRLRHQGSNCSESRNIFNWSRIAYTTAVSKDDKHYMLGGMVTNC